MHAWRFMTAPLTTSHSNITQQHQQQLIEESEGPSTALAGMHTHDGVLPCCWLLTLRDTNWLAAAGSIGLPNET
jgi:hypothetical protein